MLPTISLINLDIFPVTAWYSIDSKFGSYVYTLILRDGFYYIVGVHMCVGVCVTKDNPFKNQKILRRQIMFQSKAYS